MNLIALRITGPRTREQFIEERRGAPTDGTRPPVLDRRGGSGQRVPGGAGRGADRARSVRSGLHCRRREPSGAQPEQSAAAAAVGAALATVSRLMTVSIEARGTVASGFEAVREAFEAGVADLGEGGGALAAYVDGRPSSICGRVNARPGSAWQADTLATIFSTTKALATLCVQMLVDRGQIGSGYAHRRGVAGVWRQWQGAHSPAARAVAYGGSAGASGRGEDPVVAGRRLARLRAHCRWTGGRAAGSDHLARRSPTRRSPSAGCWTQSCGG